MVEGLSLTANILGIIVAADVVFRSTANLCDLLNRAKDAPSTVSQLLDAIKSLVSAITEVRIWAHEYQQLVPAGENGRRVTCENYLYPEPVWRSAQRARGGTLNT